MLPNPPALLDILGRLLHNSDTPELSLVLFPRLRVLNAFKSGLLNACSRAGADVQRLSSAVAVPLFAGVDVSSFPGEHPHWPHPFPCLSYPHPLERVREPTALSPGNPAINPVGQK